MALGSIFSLLTQSGVLNNTQQQPQSTGGEVVNLVESLLGGGQTSPSNSQQQNVGGEALNLVESLLGGSQTPTTGGQTQSTGDEVGNLIGSLLGGTQTAAQTTATSGQAVTSSGQNASGNILDGILNVVQSPAASTFIQPVVDNIANKLGIPPATALTVVTFAIHYLATNHGAKIANGEDMSSILQQHSNANFIQTNNISNQLAKKTGLDSQTAAKAMAETFKMLGAN